jgi:hypothetical protein
LTDRVKSGKRLMNPENPFDFSSYKIVYLLLFAIRMGFGIPISAKVA